MLLEFSDWLFLADVPANRIYCTEESGNRCNCAYCKNYFKTIDNNYPNLRYFVSRFGMDLEVPESLVPITHEVYQSSYIVQGKILRKGSIPIFVDDVAITAEEDTEPGYFTLNLGLMNLPWVLDEDPAQLTPPISIQEMLNIL